MTDTQARRTKNAYQYSDETSGIVAFLANYFPSLHGREFSILPNRLANWLHPWLQLAFF